MVKLIRHTIKALEVAEQFVGNVESLLRCKNCGKKISPWQQVCKWCGYKQY